jgi:HlyD family secretion protein
VPKDSLKSHPNNAGSSITDTSKNRIGFVWEQVGDTLEEKLIRTGINDDTHVEVLSGLTANDEIITSINQTTNKTVSATGAAPKSPFMPTRQQTPTRPPASAGSRP